MKKISISKDIVPVGIFKAGIAKYLKELNSGGKKLIITQNGKPAAVLISPEEFDDLQDSKYFIDSLLRGISNSEEGNVYTTEQLRSEILKLKSSNER